MYRVITNTPSKMPKIVKITVSEVSSTGYRVTAQIEASRGNIESADADMDRGKWSGWI